MLNYFVAYFENCPKHGLMQVTPPSIELFQRPAALQLDWVAPCPYPKCGYFFSGKAIFPEAERLVYAGATLTEFATFWLTHDGLKCDEPEDGIHLAIPFW